LRTGDVIVSVNGKKPRGFIEFSQQLLAAGDKRDVTLEILRDGERQELKFRLVREATVFNPALIRQKLGISVQEITPELAERLGLLTAQGLLVAGVDAGSQAERAGILRGQIIFGLAGTRVEDVVTAARLLQNHKKGETVTLDLLALGRVGRMVVPQRGRLELQVR
jgi:serine protease Do